MTGSCGENDGDRHFRATVRGPPIPPLFFRRLSSLRRQMLALASLANIILRCGVQRTNASATAARGFSTQGRRLPSPPPPRGMTARGLLAATARDGLLRIGLTIPPDFPFGGP